MSIAVRLAPTLPPDVQFLYRAALLQLLERLKLEPTQHRAWTEEILAQGALLTGRPELEAALRVVVDLVHQGWELRVDANGMVAVPPVKDPGGDTDERARIRAQEHVKREEQLRSPAVRTFVQDLERRRLHERSLVSVFDLMRDGRDLAARLRAARPADGEMVQPYIQAVDPSLRCEHTGLLLGDIWRYFRHTWSNQYTSVPGRSMSFLVRDSAAPRHPVIGIFALSSAVVQIGQRDRFLGWHPDTVVERLRASSEPEVALTLRRMLTQGLDELHVDDLVDDGVLTLRDLRTPSSEVIVRLEQLSRDARVQHSGSPDRSLKGDSDGADDEFWRVRARTSLFRSKRTGQLAEFLRAQLVLDSFLGSNPGPAQVGALMRDAVGVGVVRRLVRRLKAERVGICLADLTVCGAVPPYSHLLGGKLVAMLAASPVVVEAYRQRYQGAASEIASAMAGRRIVRPPHLAFIGTTSLYGVGLNQYTRVSYPCDALGGAGQTVRFRKLGRSEAYGTSQYSDETVAALGRTAQRASGGVQRVNNIFGEGQSPKLRLIRNGLDVLDLPSDGLLRHHRNRVVYGVELIDNTTDFLLGLAPPRYRFDLGRVDASAATIAAHWWQRWVIPRLGREDLLARIEQESLARPVRHGARVQLPPDECDELFLFDDRS